MGNRRENWKRWAEKNKEQLKEYRREYYRKYYYSLNGRWNENRQNAKRRNIKWELTKEEFKTFWQKPCYYCGDKIATIRLDRIDSTKGYTMGNLVSCCKKCNYAKRGLNQEEFVQHCQKVVKRSANK